ncbi:MAG: arginine repressor [Acidobacteria bacterium]|nr:arginine repressor [Acidobacteriota bacterium]
MQKVQRQQTLLNLISAERIESQAELAKRLRSRDFDVTQASISRDLEELGVVKASGVYTLPQKPAGSTMFGITSVEVSGENLIVAKCDSGLASAVAVKIDAARITEIVGTIAGDDTIFIAVRNAKDQRLAIRKIWEAFERQGKL